jgi:hypothetical protein
MLIANNKQHGTVWDELEAGLGCGAQFRVLLHLLLNPAESFTKYGLVKASGLRTPSVTQQLNRLVSLGWVKKRESSPATYQARLENETVKLIHELFLGLKGART